MRQLIFKNVKTFHLRSVNEPDRICTETVEEHVLDAAVKQSEAENFKDIFKEAKIIRKKLEHQPKWRFHGTFEDFKTPMQFATLIQWILVGPNVTLDHQPRQKPVDKMTEVISQPVLRSFKTNRKANYVPKAYSNCRKSKLTCWKVFVAANKNIIHAFQRLCDNEDDDSIHDGLIQFVIKLCCKQVPEKGLLSEAKWYLFSKYQGLYRLPPTTVEVKYKILRTQLMCQIRKSADL